MRLHFPIQAQGDKCNSTYKKAVEKIISQQLLLFVCSDKYGTDKTYLFKILTAVPYAITSAAPCIIAEEA